MWVEKFTNLSLSRLRRQCPRLRERKSVLQKNLQHAFYTLILPCAKSSANHTLSS